MTPSGSSTRSLVCRSSRPIASRARRFLSATDFDGSIEFVAPLGGKGHFGDRLARGGPGQIGPLVWEVADIDQTREWLRHNGYQIIYEYDSSQGNESEQATRVFQLVLDPDQWFGFNVTLMQRRVTRRQCCVPSGARPLEYVKRRPERRSSAWRLLSLPREITR